MFSRRGFSSLSGAVLTASFALAGQELSTAAHAAEHERLEDVAELKLVQVVFRHGARTPLTAHEGFWRHDPQWGMCNGVPSYKPVSLSIMSSQGQLNPVSEHNLKQMARKMPGGCSAGQLTDVGKTQAFSFGEQLRHRYMVQLEYLKPDFNAEAVVCRTTNFERTIKTLTGVLSGLYPACAETIQVTTSPELEEMFYADTQACPHLESFLRLSKDKGQGIVRRDPEAAWAQAELIRTIGLGESFFRDSPFGNLDVFDALTSMKVHGKSLPHGVTEPMLDVMNRLATAEYQAFLVPAIRDEQGEAVLRLTMLSLLQPLSMILIMFDGGVMLQTIVSNMKDAVERSGSGEPGPSLFLYSGHDCTLIPLLAALGVNLDVWPPFLSNLVFELWQLPSGEHVVRVMYNLEELQMPHCDPGRYLSFVEFKRNAMGHFLLVASELGSACKVTASVLMNMMGGADWGHGTVSQPNE